MSRWSLGCLAGAACVVLAGCPATVRTNGDDPAQEVRVPLDEANAVITIARAIGSGEASAAAVITDDAGSTVRLTREQHVRVSGVELSGPDGKVEYAARLPIASSYTITVVEPTVGVKDTAIDMPLDFEITAPVEGAVASLGGFRLEWTHPNNRLQVRIMISQTTNGVLNTETLGPYADTGSFDLSPEQLGGYGFVPASALTVALTKVNSLDNVAGFKVGTATAELSASRRVTPEP